MSINGKKPPQNSKRFVKIQNYTKMYYSDWEIPNGSKDRVHDHFSTGA